MEVAFLNEDRRDLELVRHISLALLKPESLIELRETGKCEVEFPETLFDADTPGHYLRRIRSLAITIPSVTGPYVPVRCTVTHLSSQIRTVPYLGLATEPRRSDVAIQSIVTSHAREDAGVFELDPRDDRYLPFEGAGVVNARFRLELPKEYRAFDYRTIQDVVFHLRYTARDGGAAFRTAVLADLADKLGPPDVGKTAPLSMPVSLKSALPDQWRLLTQPILPPAWAPSTAYALDQQVNNGDKVYVCKTAGMSGSSGGPTGTGAGISDGACTWDYVSVFDDSRSIEIPLDRKHFPFAFPDKAVQLYEFDVVAIVADPGAYPPGSGKLTMTLTAPDNAPESLTLATSGTSYGGLPNDSVTLTTPAPLGTLGLTLTGVSHLGGDLLVDGSPTRLNPDYLKDIILIVKYAGP